MILDVQFDFLMMLTVKEGRIKENLNSLIRDFFVDLI